MLGHEPIRNPGPTFDGNLEILPDPQIEFSRINERLQSTFNSLSKHSDPKNWFRGYSDNNSTSEFNHRNEFYNLLRQVIGEDFFDSQMHNLNDFASLLEVSNNYFGENLTSRIETLVYDKYDPDEQEPISLQSLKLFLLYCWRKKTKDRPLIGATPDGYIQATWKDGVNKYFIRFISEDNCMVFVKKNNDKHVAYYNFNELPVNP